MALKVDPQSEFNMTLGEECPYELDLTDELTDESHINTVKEYTYKIYDSSGEDVTDIFGGGASISSGVITFGVKAVSVGTYTLKFIATCNEMLPDEVTPYEPHVTMWVTVA